MPTRVSIQLPGMQPSVNPTAKPFTPHGAPVSTGVAVTQSGIMLSPHVLNRVGVPTGGRTGTGPSRSVGPTARTSTSSSGASKTEVPSLPYNHPASSPSSSSSESGNPRYTATHPASGSSYTSAQASSAAVRIAMPVQPTRGDIQSLPATHPILQPSGAGPASGSPSVSTSADGGSSVDTTTPNILTPTGGDPAPTSEATPMKKSNTKYYAIAAGLGLLWYFKR